MKYLITTTSFRITVGNHIVIIRNTQYLWPKGINLSSAYQQLVELDTLDWENDV